VLLVESVQRRHAESLQRDLDYDVRVKRQARSVLVAHTTHGGDDVRHRLAGQRLAPPVRESDHVGLRVPADDLPVLRLLLGRLLELCRQISLVVIDSAYSRQPAASGHGGYCRGD
jgi:hypothetical protein